VGAFLKIPLPTVPITLQTFFVLMCGNLLSGVHGSISQITYLILGLIGIPIFAYGGGPGYIFQPTFGYLLGYPFCALIVGLIREKILPDIKIRQYSKRKIFYSLFVSDIVGVIVIFSFGLGYLYLNIKYHIYSNLDHASLSTGLDIKKIINSTIMVFVPFDLLKAFLASLLSVRLVKML